MKAGYLRANQARNLAREKMPSYRVDLRLQAAEVDQLIAALPAPWDLLVETAAQTGLRAGELAGLRVRALNLTERWLRVEETAQDRGQLLTGLPTKSDAGYRVVDDLPQDLCQRLRAHVAGKGPSDYVFSSARDPGTPYRHKTFTSRVWRPTCKRLGIVARFHDLRHWHTSAILQITADPMYTCHRLGHKSPEFTMRVYGHVLHRHDRGVSVGLSALRAEGRQRNAERVAAAEAAPVEPAESATAGGVVDLVAYRKRRAG